MSIVLGQIATARSGDKGNHAHLGVIALTESAYEFLVTELTVDRLQKHFIGLGASRIERFELPRVGALNFVLYDALGGGAGQSPRIDAQGRLLGTAALEIQLPQPKNLRK